MSQRNCSEPTNFDNLAEKNFSIPLVTCAAMGLSQRLRIDINMLNYASRWDFSSSFGLWSFGMGQRGASKRKRNEKWTVSVTSTHAISVPNAEYILSDYYDLCVSNLVCARSPVCVTRDSPRILNKSFLWLIEISLSSSIGQSLGLSVCGHDIPIRVRMKFYIRLYIVCRMESWMTCAMCPNARNENVRTFSNDAQASRPKIGK